MASVRAYTLLCVAALLSLAPSALGTEPDCSTAPYTADCTGLPDWVCTRCDAITDAQSKCKCKKYAAKGYQVGVLEGCAALQYPEWKPWCFDECVGKLPVGQEWRCSKCFPSTVVDKPFCFANEGRTKLGTDAVATCASLNLPNAQGNNNFFGRSGWSCNDCLYLVADKVGQYNDWRCLACNDPALLAYSASSWTDTARRSCYNLVAGADVDSKNTVKRVDEVNDVVTCSKIQDSTLRESCYSCLRDRTGSSTWTCMGCAGKAAGPAATCFNCLKDLTKTWECTSA